MKFFSTIFTKIGWGGVIILILFIVFAMQGLMQKSALQKNPAYTKGIIIGISTGSKGSKYVDYIFNENLNRFNGSVPIAFCNKCNNCCKVGDTVLVIYQSDDPENNELVYQLPPGAVLGNQP